MPIFSLKADFAPTGDQPRAIRELTDNVRRGVKHQTLLGVTGSGKTFTIAHVIASLGKSALVLAPNKTLAAQLYSEFKAFFPDNAVAYFVSYYDYYQPEAYIPRTDLYIEKDSSINDDIDKMRHVATHALLERRDTIIVASVSCIYGLGSPEAYHGMLVDMKKGMTLTRREAVGRLIEIRYERNDLDFHRGTFRVRGDVIDVFPPYEEDRAIRLEFFNDELDGIAFIDGLKGTVVERLDRVAIYPGSHYVATAESRNRVLESIRSELDGRLDFFKREGRVIEHERLRQRTLYDMEMIEEIGFCKGIENYSRHFDGRAPGAPPPTLLRYFPKDFLLVVDESHITIPQVGGMFNGDRNRKGTLVEYGFRLPSALDNRPLKFGEFEAALDDVIYVSATPAEYELAKSKGVVVEQVVRPTGLLDPPVVIRPVANQVDDLLEDIRATVEKGERVLVTTLTKRMAENLHKYLAETGVKSCYLHSDIATIERFQILCDLRAGVHDVLVGINLLREGLDLPEVSLVAILDGDKEGFLRSERSLIQTFGRAARNARGRVVVYADTRTGSLDRAITETGRRRAIQADYNEKHGITPTTIVKDIPDPLYRSVKGDYVEPDAFMAELPEEIEAREIPDLIRRLEKDMAVAAKKLEYEEAARIRDRIKRLRGVEMALGGENRAES